MARRAYGKIFALQELAPQPRGAGKNLRSRFLSEGCLAVARHYKHTKIKRRKNHDKK
jgi:hypothetical protein